MNTVSRRSFASFFLASCLAVGLAFPAYGDDSLSSAIAKRQAAQNKGAAIARKLNTLNASDKQLKRGLLALNVQVATQEAKANNERRAAAVATARFNETSSQLAATEKRIAQLRQLVVDRAMESYVSAGNDDEFTRVFSSADPNEGSRREAMLSSVSENDMDVSEALRGAKQDQGILRNKAAADKKEAEKRKTAVEKALGTIKKARAEKARISASIHARVRDYAAEARATAAQEQKLNSLILARQSPAGRASRGGSGAIAFRSGGGNLPVNGPITSEFGYRWGRLHAGIDIGCPIGTPIAAFRSGTVIYSGWMSGYGNVVIVDHGGGFSTLYGHQSRRAVSVGQHVGQGQIIGYSGNTGNVTGPHLHFETRINGVARNPRQYI